MKVTFEEVKTSSDALFWATENKDKDKVIHLITDSFDAFVWATLFHDDKDKVIHCITNTFDALLWFRAFPEDKGYFRKKGLL